LLVDIRTGRTLPKAALLIGALILLVLKAGYAMQPPPPPLDLARFKELISLADLILVGEIGEVRETEKAAHGETHGAVEADLRVEELLKGKVRGDRIIIRESYPVLNPSSPETVGKGVNESQKMIVGMKAGPSAYHGLYTRGMRVVVMLEKVEGTHAYEPLGSGSYDRHLCEFVIENDGIKARYFKFAEDLSHYAGSETDFVRLIKQLQDQDS
jgi:hypothetical protein